MSITAYFENFGQPTTKWTTDGTASSEPERRIKKPAGRDDLNVDTAILCYEEALHAAGLVDFDDLLHLPLKLLDKHADLISQYRDRYRWVSVDEFQDIDSLQYALIRLLVPANGSNSSTNTASISPSHGKGSSGGNSGGDSVDDSGAGDNLCVIGDPDQAIYGFRGSDVRFFQRFLNDYPKAHTIHLTRNYRSTRPIVDASLQLIAPSSLVTDRRLHSLLQCPDRVQIHHCPTDRAEAEFVVHTIEKLIGGSTFFSLDSGRVESLGPAPQDLLDQPDQRGQPDHLNALHEELSFGDFAVLYRTDAQSTLLMEAFERSGMPYEKRSHRALRDQPLVQELRTQLDTMTQIEKQANRSRQSVWETVHQAARVLRESRFGNETSVIDKSHTDEVDRIDTHARRLDQLLASLRPLAMRSGDDLSAFFSDLAMGVDIDLWDPRADRVSLMTLHAAKGLEFSVVFLVGCEDGVMPLRWGAKESVDLDEERRLFFVGMTRAGRRLYLTHTSRRRWRGKPAAMDTSPFLGDIEQRLTELYHHRFDRKKKTADEQLALF